MIDPTQLSTIRHLPSYKQWRKAVLGSAQGTCQICDAEVSLDAAHIQSRKARPDLAFDISNGIALCRSCHMKYDHFHKHRPSGRPPGYKKTDETKRKHSQAGKRRAKDPKFREERRQSANNQWDKQGRKPLRNCDNCGQELPRIKITRGNRFCDSTCHYSFRLGKPRSGY